MTTDIGIARPSLPTNEQHVHASISRALDGLDEPMMLIAVDGATVHWSTPSAMRLFELDSACIGRLNVDQFCPLLKPVISCLNGSSELQELDIAGERYTCQFSRPTDDVASGIGDTFVWFKMRETDTRNIRQYLEAREKLFSTSRTISVSEMATTLAHELNQPIGSISNILKGTRARLENTDCEENILQALDKAAEQTLFASRIIARIRDFTRSRQPVRTDCRVDDLLDNSIALLDWVLDSNAVSVERSYITPSPVVNGDETMLQQVFTNLIRNAVDAMQSVPEKDRRIRISVNLNNRNVRINVEDSGPGLTSEDEQNLFVPFVTQKTQGMGVGLNICRSFIELHQGRLWLKPNQQGGCTACVVLAAVEYE